MSQAHAGSQAEAIAARLAAIRSRIEQASRDPAEITIVAVTKGRPVEACSSALAAGLDILGENRVQEALGKRDRLPEARWHLIGHLQSNKVPAAAGRFELIQSVDSVRLAHLIHRHAPDQAVLLQVNVARETTKHGVEPERALEVGGEVARLLPVRGLMALGPLGGDAGHAFAELRRLRDEAEQRWGQALPVLSMGMSDDLEAALGAGSTMLRLGRALFGAASQTQPWQSSRHSSTTSSMP